MLRIVGIEYLGLSSQNKAQSNGLVPATMVKHHTAYHPHGYTDKMNDQAVEEHLETCALTYEDYQRIACCEPNSSARTTVSQG